MKRREFLGTAAAAAAAMAAGPRTSMGVATTCYMTVWRPRDTYEFLEHCISIGAGGIQSSLSSLEPAAIKKVRDRAEQAGMYIEVMGPLPRTDVAQFEAIVKATKEAGAICLRSACLGGRRYETFATFDDWRKFIAESRAAIERAIPIVEKHKVKWALENHKDWTADEFVSLLNQYKSEYLGVCLDTGNNMSLLDDPMQLVEALAPWAISTHIKDMAVQPYEDGFLLSEVPIGDGMLDIPKMLAAIRKHHPESKMTLEMITRNPLKVPCLTDKYWNTMPQRNGRVLARMMKLVAANPPRKPLPVMDGKSPEEQRAYEAENVKVCLAAARERLGLTA